MADPAELNRAELHRYLDRVGDRWPIERAILGGTRVTYPGAPQPERGPDPGAPHPGRTADSPLEQERSPEYVLILVSAAYDGMPWLERVHQAGALWDALEMGASAVVHCYTPVEFERKRVSLPLVRDTAEWGLELI